MYHKLMNGEMGPAWTPEMIGRLTPIQVMCMVCKSPPRREMLDPEGAFKEYERAQKAWRE